MLSSIYQAVETQVKFKYFGQPVIKPFVVHDYNMKMGGVDTTDNFLSHYITPKCFKWSKKLLPHFISMVILNAYILNRKYGNKKMSHSANREYITQYLITTSLETVTCMKRKPPVPIDNTEMRLSGKHFVSKILLLGQKGKPLPISVKFVISHENSLHVTATMIYNYPTNTLLMGVNCILISLSASHHVLKYFTLMSTTQNRHLQTG